MIAVHIPKDVHNHTVVTTETTIKTVVLGSHWKHCFSASTSVPSALEVYLYTKMRYINRRFDGVSPSGRRMSSGLTLYFLWVLEWPTRPILAVNCLPQSSQVKRLVSADLAAGTDWLVEPFRRLRFSTAVTIRTSSKCCTPVKQAFCHLDLLSARSSQVAGSIPVDSRLAFKLSLKRSSGRQLGRVPDSNSA